MRRTGGFSSEVSAAAGCDNDWCCRFVCKFITDLRGVDSDMTWGLTNSEAARC